MFFIQPQKAPAVTTRIFLGMITMLFVYNIPQGRAFPGQWRKVQWVYDGDTILLSDGTKVRYIGVNAPEISHGFEPAEAFGHEAKALNRKLVMGQKVRLVFDHEKKDRYGRCLAYVFLSDETFVNAELIKEGVAYCLFREPNKKYNTHLLSLQRQAMRKGAGLWKPFYHEQGVFIGNSRTKRFHREGCSFEKIIAPKNRTVFRNRYEAFWAGYSPCRACR